MKDECENLTQQLDEFRKMTDQFITLTDQVLKKPDPKQIRSIVRPSDSKSSFVTSGDFQNSKLHEFDEFYIFKLLKKVLKNCKCI